MSRKLTLLNLSGVGCAVAPVFAMLLCASVAFAQDAKPDLKAERERKVRVAIALAEASQASEPSPVAVAPAPRAIVPKDYAIGRKEALLDQSPLVVYVSCDGPKVDGAITCFVPAPTFGEVSGPAIVVGYPSGDRMLIEKTLPIPPPVGELRKAVENAAKKIETPAKSMPADPASSYKIKADLCGPCGASCACKTGDCPVKCPAAAPATTPKAAQSQPAPVTYREVITTDRYGRQTRWLVADGSSAQVSPATVAQTVYPVQPLTFSSCPNGRCPNQR